MQFELQADRNFTITNDMGMLDILQIWNLHVKRSENEQKMLEQQQRAR